MLKGLKISCLFVLSVLFSVSCSKTKTYAEYVEEERKNIKKYIAANNIDVVNSKPEGTGEWKTDEGKDIYFQTSSGLYYHQIALGDGSMAPLTGYTVYVRYIGKDLSGSVIYNCTERYAPNPQSFIMSSSPSGQTFGVGFQEAVRYMRAGGRCKVIIPFDIGNGSNYTLSGSSRSDMDNYAPMLYEIWLKKVE